MHTYADDRGFSLMSVFDHLPALPGQVNVSTMYPGAVKAWHRHALQDDHWVALSGALKIGLFNTESHPITAVLRLAGATPGADVQREIPVAPQTGQSIHLGEHRPGVLHIPAGLWHGGVSVGGRSAVLLYYVTRRYDAANPDEERQAWDAFAFDWGVEHR